MKEENSPFNLASIFIVPNPMNILKSCTGPTCLIMSLVYIMTLPIKLGLPAMINQSLVVLADPLCFFYLLIYSKKGT